jgi:hypothetical protein
MKTRECPSEYKRVKAIMSDVVYEEPVTVVPDGVREAKEHLMKAANLLILCVDAVNKAVAPHVPPIAQTEGFFQAQVASLFIEASRAGYVFKMPSRPIK